MFGDHAGVKVDGGREGRTDMSFVPEPRGLGMGWLAYVTYDAAGQVGFRLLYNDNDHNDE